MCKKKYSECVYIYDEIRFQCMEKIVIARECGMQSYQTYLIHVLFLIQNRMDDIKKELA